MTLPQTSDPLYGTRPIRYSLSGYPKLLLLFFGILGSLQITAAGARGQSTYFHRSVVVNEEPRITGCAECSGRLFSIWDAGAGTLLYTTHCLLSCVETAANLFSNGWSCDVAEHVWAPTDSAIVDEDGNPIKAKFFIRLDRTDSSAWGNHDWVHKQYFSETIQPLQPGDSEGKSIRMPVIDYIKMRVYAPQSKSGARIKLDNDDCKFWSTDIVEMSRPGSKRLSAR